MSCETYQQAVSSMMDGRAPDGGLEEVFRHLGACGACREFFLAVRSVERVLAVSEPVPARVDSAVRAGVEGAAALRGAVPRRKKWSGLVKLRIPVPAPALAVVGVILALMIFRVFGGPGGAGAGETSVVFVPTLPEVRVEAGMAEADHE